MDTLSISDLARTTTSTPSILVTRFTGKRYWEALEARLCTYNREAVLALSFEGVDVMDASFADEVFARLAVMRARKEYPFCYIILTDMSETCEENLEMALTTRIEREPNDKPHLRNCVLMNMKSDKAELCGKYENHVLETFSLLISKRSLSTRDSSDLLDVSLNAASTRLKTVADLGLAKREEVRDTQGKQYIYHSLI